MSDAAMKLKTFVMKLRSRAPAVSSKVIRTATLLLIICLITVPAHSQRTVPAQALSAHSPNGGWWTIEDVYSAAKPLLDPDDAARGHFDASQTPETKAKDYPDPRLRFNWTNVSANVGAEAYAAALLNTEYMRINWTLYRGLAFASLNTNYAAWLVGLSDSRSLTNVNGMIVYPLFEIDYAQWRLPVALCVPPARESGVK